MTPIYNMKHLSAEIKFSVSEYVLAALCVPSLPLLKRKKTKMVFTVFNEIESIASYYMQSPEQEGSTAGG